MVTIELRTSFRRTSRTIPTWHSKNLFHNSLFIMKRMDPPLQFWLGTAKHAKKRTNRSKLPFHYTAYIHFFHVECKQPTTAKMHKMFIALKSYCACRVVSLATIGWKHYFNFILNRTRSGRELFDHPSYLYLNIICTNVHRNFGWTSTLVFTAHDYGADPLGSLGC